jgi:precorrin-6A/cobalt-precorrin-6A reductase
MPPERILILGGTGEAREIAASLVAEGFAPITSLAGVTQAPHRPPGEVQVGGFGGSAGLAAFVRRQKVAAIVDATHPFAQRISRQAASAALDCDVPYVRFERAPWVSGEGDRWVEVAGLAQAVAALPSGARAFVTVGRKEVGLFFARADIAGVARMIERPPEAVPANWTLLLSRPPFGLAGETALLQRFRITHVVSKNAGGEQTRAKLDAARHLGLPVIMVARPSKPASETFATAGQLATLLRGKLAP